jgi:putative ABC transport system permease protein
LVLLLEKFSAQGLDRIPVSAPEYNDYTKELKSMEIGGFDYVDLNLTAGGIPERIPGAVVTPSVFQVLGAQPSKGRVFTPNEFGEGNDNVVLMSERLWKRRFNSDPEIIGRQLSINGGTVTVVGLMPEGFQFPLPLFNLQGGTFGQKVDLWRPIAFSKTELDNRGSRSYGIIGRLKPGVSLGQAQAEIDTIIARWYGLFPDNYDPATKFGATVYPFHDQVIGGMRSALGILLGAVVVVLMIACANLTTMLLARAAAREREIAIRVALGAGRLRLLKQVFTESVLLALIGGAAGVVLALWGVELSKTIGAHTVPRLREVNVDVVVLGVTLAICVGTGIIFGLAPGLANARPELTEALKEGGRGSSQGKRRNRLRNGLVIAEVALALVLLSGAGLLIKSFVRLQNVKPGFDPQNVLTMEVSLPTAKYARGKPVADFYAEFVRRVQALPGVEAAALTSILPLSGTNSDSSFAIEGRNPMEEKVYPDEEIRAATPDYFKALGIPLLYGRVFDPRDNADAPKVVVVNQAFAKKWFPNQEVVGKRITFSDPRKPDVEWVTIIGLVGNIHHQGLEIDPKPEYYLPHAQRSYRGMVLTVRSKQDPRALADVLRKELHHLDPELPAANVRTLESVASDSIAPRRLSVVLMSVFAGVALVLASVGIYGVMSFLVVQRTHEIGVRMALGAQRSDVLKLVLVRSLKLISAGTIIGLIVAVMSTHTLRALLYSVSAFDAATFALVTILLGAIALAASYLPAMRATRADPMVVLGHNT